MKKDGYLECEHRDITPDGCTDYTCPEGEWRICRLGRLFCLPEAAILSFLSTNLAGVAGYIGLRRRRKRPSWRKGRLWHLIVSYFTFIVSDERYKRMVA